ncbi:MAG TPA: aspartate aminotransferase [Firmicutes bacterium]|jgi:aspartate/methionine/tyrosine aminotransferase|nr:aspartate aminotransferase [Bacillota bacterium]
MTVIEQMLATRMSRLGTEKAFEVLAKAKALEAQGKHIVHLEIGEPDFDTPQNIIDAGIEALNNGYTHYSPATGIAEARQAVADYVSRYKKVPAVADEVVLMPGAKPLMLYTMLALINPGDEVIYPNPGYPIYESAVNFVGGKAIPMPLLEKNDYTLDIDDLASKITDRTKLIIINSPANPTGGLLSRANLEQIADLVRGKNIMVMSDEIYDRLVYDDEPVSIASLPGMKEQTIILDGFSKTYAMTGWRLGYGILPLPLVERIARLAINTNSCAAAFTQMAGVEALSGSQAGADKMKAEFKGRRDVIVDGLNAIPGITCRKPLGAFYAFPNIRGLGKSSQEIADYILQEGGVAVLSGTDFGEYGEGHLRLSYANSVENIQLALERIETAVRKLR